MNTLKEYLKNNLSKAGRIAVLGIGSELRGDDGAGVITAKLVKEKNFSRLKVKVFIGDTAPENMTGEIKRFEPSHIIMIDTLEMDEVPGTIVVLKPLEAGGGVSFSTHMMPARILADYLYKSMKCDIVILGIQPSSVKFGKSMNTFVKQSCTRAAFAINAVIVLLAGRKQRSLPA